VQTINYFNVTFTHTVHAPPAKEVRLRRAVLDDIAVASSSQDVITVTPTPPPTRVSSPTFNGTDNNVQVDDFPFCPRAPGTGSYRLSGPQTIHEICQMVTPPVVTSDAGTSGGMSCEDDIPGSSGNAVETLVEENVVMPPLDSPIVPAKKGRVPKKVSKPPPKKATKPAAGNQVGKVSKPPPKKAPKPAAGNQVGKVAKAPAKPTRKRSSPSSSVEVPAPKR
jgi:hypothetical protein